MGCSISTVSPEKAKDTTSGNKGRPNSAKDTASDNKGRPNSAKDTASDNKGRQNSVKDTASDNKGRPNSVKDTSDNKGRQNSVKDTSDNKGRPNSVKDTTSDNKGRQNSVKDTSDNKGRQNSVKDTSDNKGRPNSAKDIKSGDKGRQNSAKDTTSGNRERQSSAKTIKDDVCQYEKIDEHARKAPQSLKNSAEELVNYMSTVSKDPKMLVRGFYVWISENIRYDVEGFFGWATMASCDAESVMKGGRSVCEGYATVMELLCRQAGVPVKKISGFAKGYGNSPADSFTVHPDIDHAWNAVQLNDKWYLIDGTWGAGHLDDMGSFIKAFNNFFFLTDPKHFISTHFPYMDKDMEESKKWQLLSKPISLDEFNKNLKYAPQAFKLGAQAVSHQNGYIEMKNGIQMTFKSVRKEELEVTARLMLKEGNIWRAQPNATFGYPENGLYKLMIQPPKPGTYKMEVFGKAVSDESLHEYLMEYLIHCTEVKERAFEYPLLYTAALTEKSTLHEPLRGKLPENTEIKFCVSAPHLKNVMVGRILLEKSGTMFSGNITTGAAGQQVSMYGTRGDKYSEMQGLYAFKTV